MANKKESSAQTPSQFTTFTLELYPEWDTLGNILTYIAKNYKYALILHDKDVYEDGDHEGEIKKPHIHVVIKCKSRRTKSSVKNEFAVLTVPKNLIDSCNERQMIRYLTHIDYPEKAQYSKDEIQTNMKADVDLCYTDEMTANSAFYAIDQWINEQQGIVSQHELNQYCYKQNLLGGLRKFGGQIASARIEHNRKYETSTIVEGKAEIKAVQIAKARDTKTAEMIKALDMFGTIKTEIPDGNGLMIPVIIAKRKPENEPENEPKQQTAIWEGLPQK